MSIPPPLCHSTPAKDMISESFEVTDNMKPEVSAVPFAFGGQNNFAFAPSSVDTASIPRDAETESIMSKPILDGRQKVTMEPDSPGSPVTVISKESKAHLQGISPGLVKEVQQSLQLSQQLTGALQRLAGHLGCMDINTSKQSLIPKPKIPQPPPPLHSNDVNFIDPSKFLNLIENTIGTHWPGAPIETASVSDSEPSQVSRPFWFIPGSEYSGHLQATKPLPYPKAIPTKSGVVSLQTTISQINASEPKETKSPAITVRCEPSIPNPEDKKKATIEEWVERLPVSKPNEKHVHAFDTDKPIIDIPTNSLPKPKETTLRFSPPTPKYQTPRRHSDSFCSSDPARLASAVAMKQYDFGKRTKRQPRTPTNRMKYINRSPEKPGQREDEATDLTVTEEVAGPAQEELPQTEPTSSNVINDMYNPGDPDALLLHDEEVRSDPYFAPIVPLKDVESGIEMTTRFFEEIETIQYDRLWSQAYKQVKARRVGVYNPSKEKRDYDKRKGEKEVYNPARYGTVFWKVHQVFECYFSMREVLVEIDKNKERAKAAKLELEKLQEQCEKAGAGINLDKMVSATHIRRCQLELSTVLPEQMKKYQVRKTMLKRVAESSLWDIAKLDETYAFRGEMLHGIVWMRDYFAEIKPAYARDILTGMGIEVRQEGF
ncbi:hypothetical protein TWF281_002167 [Arthrobotrys megalospora]